MTYRLTVACWCEADGTACRSNGVLGYNIFDYAREAHVEVTGHPTREAALAAAKAVRDCPDQEGIYPVCDVEEEEV